MSKIAVIGSLESCLPFRALGYSLYTAESAEGALDALVKLQREDIAIIFITETLAALIPEVLREWQAKPTPAVILIPGAQGSLGLGQRNIKILVEKAVGMDIFREV